MPEVRIVPRFVRLYEIFREKSILRRKGLKLLEVWPKLVGMEATSGALDTFNFELIWPETGVIGTANWCLLLSPVVADSSTSYDGSIPNPANGWTNLNEEELLLAKRSAERRRVPAFVIAPPLHREMSDIGRRVDNSSGVSPISDDASSKLLSSKYSAVHQIFKPTLWRHHTLRMLFAAIFRTCPESAFSNSRERGKGAANRKFPEWPT